MLQVPNHRWWRIYRISYWVGFNSEAASLITLRFEFPSCNMGLKLEHFARRKFGRKNPYIIWNYGMVKSSCHHLNLIKTIAYVISKTNTSFKRSMEFMKTIFHHRDLLYFKIHPFHFNKKIK